MKHFRRWLVVRALHKEGTDESIYKKAEKLMEGQFGWGSAAVIGKSFRIVEEHLENPVEALRYYRGLREGQELAGTQYPSCYKVKPAALTPKSASVIGPKSAGQEPDVGNEEPSSDGAHSSLEVIGETPAPTEPGECTLNDPSPEQKPAAVDALGSLDDLDSPCGSV
jgi:hypothetical protein